MTTPDATGSHAFKRYLADCDKHAIEPDIGGAFYWAWQARAAAPAPSLSDDQITKVMEESIGKFCYYEYDDLLVFARALLASHQAAAPAPSLSDELSQRKIWTDAGGYFHRLSGMDHACMPLSDWRSFMAALTLPAQQPAVPSLPADPLELAKQFGAQFSGANGAGTFPTRIVFSRAAWDACVETFAARTALMADALIEEAEKYAEAYDGDDRPCIKTDVLNAFYHGAHWAKKASSLVAQEAAQPPAQPEPNATDQAHVWNKEGERCLVCGDKDWMGGPCSGPVQPEPVGYVNGDELDNMLDNMLDDRTATIQGTQSGWRKTPLYLHPPKAGAAAPAEGADRPV